MNYSVNGNELVIKGRKISFENDIIENEVVGDVIVLTLKNISTGDVQKQPLNNILAIDENAKVIWKISEITKINIFYSGFFLKIIEGNMKVLVAIDCMGIRYTIRLSDLTLIKKEGFRF